MKSSAARMTKASKRSMMTYPKLGLI
jgi:hypothetical protein